MIAQMLAISLLNPFNIQPLQQTELIKPVGMLELMEEGKDLATMQAEEETIDQYEMWTISDLHIREYAEESSTSITIVKKNTQITVLSTTDNGWSEVEYEDCHGYMCNDYLSKVEPQPITQDNTQENVRDEYLGKFKLTAYCSCSSCCGKWAGSPTASGKKPLSNHTVAMGDIPFGTKLSINEEIYIVEDRGTPYGHVDIYFDSHSDAQNFGVQHADVYIIP